MGRFRKLLLQTMCHHLSRNGFLRQVSSCYMSEISRKVTCDSQFLHSIKSLKKLHLSSHFFYLIQQSQQQTQQWKQKKNASDLFKVKNKDSRLTSNCIVLFLFCFRFCLSLFYFVLFSLFLCLILILYPCLHFGVAFLKKCENSFMRKCNIRNQTYIWD